MQDIRFKKSTPICCPTALIFILSAAILSGCATQMVPYSASEYLYTTKLSTSALFSELGSSLQKIKYKVRKKDVSAGVFLSSPRRFSFNSKDRRVRGEQTLQIRQEGGSVKMRIAYKCFYPDNTKEDSCAANDPETVATIQTLEKKLVNTLAPVFEMTSADVEGRGSVDLDKPEEPPAGESESSP